MTSDKNQNIYSVSPPPTQKIIVDTDYVPGPALEAKYRVAHMPTGASGYGQRLIYISVTDKLY